MPRLTIGLPVYNGENYVAEALASLLGQTFGDFALIVSDNASTDATEEICRGFAARDARVSYRRFDRNRGAAVNFNHVFDLAESPYFKWAAHDDVCAPEYLARCVEVLDARPEIVLCHTRSGRLDGEGALVGDYDYPVRYDAPRVADRFRDLIVVRHDCINVFGVVRRDVLARTPRIGSYVASDRVLLAELALHGPLAEIPERLFHRRDHDRVSSVLGEHDDRLTWFDPDLAGAVSYPNWRVVREYAAALGRAPLSAADRAACWGRLPEHVWSRRRHLLRDLEVAAKKTLNRTPTGRRFFLALKRLLGRGADRG